MNGYYTAENCRTCFGKNLEMVLDLGQQPLANLFVHETELRMSESKFPLRLYVCEDCFLVQLLDTVKKEVLFSNYPYMTSASKPLLNHFSNYALHIYENFLQKQNDPYLIEIGSNDGTLLREFIQLGVPVLGIEPASNLAKMANEATAPTENAFFCYDLAKKLSENRKPGVIVANNVVGHIEDLKDFMQGINLLLKDDGIFVFEVPYLIDMLEKIDYTNVYHEHKSYFSILPLTKLMDELGLQIFNIQKQEVHGGTIRVFVCKKGAYEVRSVVGNMLDKESDYGLQRIETYRKFAHDVKLSRDRFLKEITRIKKQGKRIFGYGASAKGNVLLNYCGINTSIVDFVTDTTPLKQGFYTPGTHIPILPPTIMKSKGDGDVALMLAWDYEEDILEREREFRKRGGLFLIPMRDPRLV